MTLTGQSELYFVSLNAACATALFCNMGVDAIQSPNGLKKEL
jgi:hypothetical protein